MRIVERLNYKLLLFILAFAKILYSGLEIHKHVLFLVN